jgi:foldase protein PrsA
LDFEPLDKEIAKKGGDLGFVLEDALPAEITKQVKELKKNQISKPFKLTDKWLIIQLTDKRPAKIAKFEDAKEALSQSLSAKALQDFISNSLKEANISIVVNN